MREAVAELGDDADSAEAERVDDGASAVVTAEELDALIVAEGLKPDETRAFVDNAFRDGAVPTGGTAITRILPPVSRFAPGAGHAAKKQTVIEKLLAFFDRYFGLA